MYFLKVPLVRARSEIERDDRRREEVVAAPGTAPDVGRSVSDAHVDHAELGIDRDVVPDATAANLVRIALPRTGETVAWTRNREELPQLLTGFRVVRAQLPACTVVAACGADIHASVVEHRRRRGVRSRVVRQLP